MYFGKPNSVHCNFCLTCQWVYGRCIWDYFLHTICRWSFTGWIWDHWFRELWNWVQEKLVPTLGRYNHENSTLHLTLLISIQPQAFLDCTQIFLKRYSLTPPISIMDVGAMYCMLIFFWYKFYIHMQVSVPERWKPHTSTKHIHYAYWRGHNVGQQL